MAKCKGCGAQIVWVKMPGGKSMPCDPDLIPYWEREGASGKVVTPNGEVLSCVFSGDADKATGVGYVLHWSTCPKAEQFRRKKDGTHT